MSRKIKDIKDKHTGELVYPRTHVSAVVLSSDSTLEDLIEVKQDKINDLDEIRAGAAKGATALQSVPSEYVTETELSNKGYATISALNNKVDVINGKQLSTEDFTTALKNKLEGLSNYDDTELSDAISTLRGDFDNIVSGDTTTAIKTFNEVIAFLDGLTDTQDLESIIANIEQQIAGKMDKVTLAKVATSGSYNDLSNKPTIPAAVTESTVSGWGFTKNAGTITGVSANGTSVATSGVANIPAASTSVYGVTKLSSATNSTSTTLAATASAVKAAYDLANSYKGTVTGVKINGTTKNPSSGVVDLGTVITAHQTLKTINGESIVGSGNITISGGSSDANVQAVDTGDVLDDVNVDYATTAYVDDKVANISLTDYATKTYVDGLVGDINSVLESIINGGSAALITFTVDVTEYQAEEGMTWGEWVDSEYNTAGFICNGNTVHTPGYAKYVYNVTPSSVIGAGQRYGTTGASND